MGHYIWQKRPWPNFTWKSKHLLRPLGQARKAQGQIIAQADFIGLDAQADVLVEEAFTTSTIEGEKLNVITIRSSVARRLGLPTAGLPAPSRHVDGLVEMLIDATTRSHERLTRERLFGWHAGLFPTGHSGIHPIEVGKWRTGVEPMRVISGTMGKERVHYEAPPAKLLPGEMKAFLDWWHENPGELDGLLRAGIAHFWFVSIHPFEDGNGRIARAITDMALAQDEGTGRRLYSLSSQIVKERDAYYRILEKAQKGDGDITDWLQWFLHAYSNAILNSQNVIEKALRIAKFWQANNHLELNDRQRKVVKRLLEEEPTGFEGGLTNRKYVSLTKTSRESAKRDIADLEKKGILKRNIAKGRSISCRLSKESE